MGSRVRYTRFNIVTNSFYQLPKFLFNIEFSDLSNDARVLYALLRNRHEISVVNGWFDEKDEVYQYFKRKDMQAMLHLSDKTVTRAMQDLKDFGLLEEQRQGCNKPNRIYLLAAVGTLHGIGEVASNADKQRTRKNSVSGSVDSTTPDTENLRVHKNHNKKNQTDIDISPVMSSQSEPKPDGQDMAEYSANGCATWMRSRNMDGYTAWLKEHIRYSDLSVSRPYDMPLVDEFVAIVIDVVMTDGETIRIGCEYKPRALVTSVLMKLTYEDVDHAIDQFKSVTERITKKKQYILTMLYNCKLEREAHYTNAYISDRWQ